MAKNIAIIASRLRCIDAMSVEAEKWIDKYVKLGYNVHLICGKFGEPVELPNLELPEMDYKHPEVRGVKNIVFGTKLDKQGKKAAEILLDNLVNRIKTPLKNYIIKNKIELLSVEDILMSMKNLPFNIALSQVIRETNLPTISRFHYLPWDNVFFTRHENIPKITESIPLIQKNIIYVAPTESAQVKASQKKVNAKVIPNTIDLDKLSKSDEYNKDFRKTLGISEDGIIFLQPTRLKRNKGVEKSIRIVAEINEVTKKDNALIITGSPVYQRGNYFEAIIKRAQKLGVNLILANDKIFLGRHQNPQKKFYSIGDAYVHADFVLYPNVSDAFGNPVIEACAYQKPLIVNKYPNLEGIMEKGFQFIVLDNKVTQETISDVYEIITDKEKMKAMTQKNFKLLKEHYSSDILDDKLIPMMNSLEQTPGLISRITVKFWGRKQQNLKSRKVKITVKRNDNRKQSGREKIRENDLKNKKGSYREPEKKSA